YLVKYGEAFTRCLKALTEVVTQVAEESGLSGPYAIISQEGLEQPHHHLSHARKALTGSMATARGGVADAQMTALMDPRRTQE
ncbi:hypothetical protein TELCIR_18628, partial [Teladorsagia circumcincta]